jgi:uncharacterized RDD family membrane protein YckC
MNIARYEKRILGWLIDKLLSWLVLAAALTLCLLYLPEPTSLFFEILLAFAASYLFFVVSSAIALWAFNGYTLGMALVGIRTCHPSGERLRLGESFVKSLMTGLFGMDLLNAAYMLFAHTERSAFDRLTKTLVVDARH